jgi:hypothetical protein
MFRLITASINALGKGCPPSATRSLKVRQTDRQLDTPTEREIEMKKKKTETSRPTYHEKSQRKTIYSEQTGKQATRGSV